MSARLFKYVTAERIDILRRGRIAFPEPMVFNDPFEMLPHFSDFTPELSLQTVFDAFGEPEKDRFAERLYWLGLVLAEKPLPPFEQFRSQLNRDWPDVVRDAVGQKAEMIQVFKHVLKSQIG